MWKLAWDECLEQGRMLISVGEPYQAFPLRPGQSIERSRLRTASYLFSDDLPPALSRKTRVKPSIRSRSGSPYQEEDEPFVRTALDFFKSDAARSVRQATELAVPPDAVLAGTGSWESRFERIYRAVLTRWNEERE